jgi:hypothetical protein
MVMSVGFDNLNFWACTPVHVSCPWWQKSPSVPMLNMTWKGLIRLLELPSNNVPVHRNNSCINIPRQLSYERWQCASVSIQTWLGWWPHDFIGQLMVVVDTAPRHSPIVLCSGAKCCFCTCDICDSFLTLLTSP